METENPSPVKRVAGKKSGPRVRLSLKSQVNRLTQLTEKQQRLHALRPLEPVQVRALEEKVIAAFDMEVIATSIQIEGNSLTLRETEMVISKGLTISGKPLKDHLEAVNLKAAFDYIKALSKNKAPLSGRLIRELHQIVLSRISDEWAGIYRSVPVRISGALHQPPHFLAVAELMEAWGNEIPDPEIHPVLLAADVHERLVTIHPFVDGNGRTARLLMNLVLLRAGYPAIVIPSDSDSRLAYYDALEKTQTTEDSQAFREFIITATDVMLDRYLETLSPSSL